MGLRWDPSSDLLKLGVKISKGTVLARWIDQIVEIPPVTNLCGNVILMLTVHVLGRDVMQFLEIINNIRAVTICGMRFGVVRGNSINQKG